MLLYNKAECYNQFISNDKWEAVLKWICELFYSNMIFMQCLNRLSSFEYSRLLNAFKDVDVQDFGLCVSIDTTVLE